MPYPVGLAPKAGEEEKWCRVGDGLSMHVNMPGKALADIDEAEREALLKSPEFVTGIEVLDPAKEEGRTGFRIHWKAMQAPDFLLRAQRVQEVVDLGEGRSEYVTYASFGGYGASVVKWTNGSKLIDRFGDMARDLKGWSEKLYAEQKVASA